MWNVRTDIIIAISIIALHLHLTVMKDIIRAIKIWHSSIFIVLILVCLTISYVKIVQVFLQSRRNVNPAGNEGEEMKIKVKVALIIGIKLVSWLTIIGVMIYYHVTGSNVPDSLFEITAICLVPANSLMNPIFNSEIFQSIKKWCKGKCCHKEHGERRRVKESLELQPVRNATNAAPIE